MVVHLVRTIRTLDHLKSMPTPLHKVDRIRTMQTTLNQLLMAQLIHRRTAIRNHLPRRIIPRQLVPDPRITHPKANKRTDQVVLNRHRTLSTRHLLQGHRSTALLHRVCSLVI